MTWGLIYVVRNRRLGDTIVKIGKTNRSIEERIRELNAATSNLGNFEPLAFFPVSDIDKAESECHSALSHQREQRNREFFGGDIGTIVKTVETICKRYIPNSFMADNFRSVSEEPRNDKIDGLELRVAKLREEEEKRKHDVERQEKHTRALASSLTAATRSALADFAQEIANNSQLSLLIPSEEATLLDDPFLDKAADELLESRLQGNLTAVAEARIFKKIIDKIPLLTETDVTPRPTIDDGRVFDLVIFPVRISPEARDEMSEHYGNSLLSMDEVGLLIAVLGFEYTNYGSLFASQRYLSAKLNMSEPGYSYSVLAVSPILFDPLEVADRFAQTIAENLDQNVGNARRVEIGEDGQQGIQQLFKPNTSSIYELKRQKSKRL